MLVDSDHYMKRGAIAPLFFAIILLHFLFRTYPDFTMRIRNLNPLFFKDLYHSLIQSVRYFKVILSFDPDFQIKIHRRLVMF